MNPGAVVDIAVAVDLDPQSRHRVDEVGPFHIEVSNSCSCEVATGILLDFDRSSVVDCFAVRLMVAVDDFAALVHQHQFGVEPAYSSQAVTCSNR